ncbi:MAG: F-box protein [Legionellaceae bacterium]|nr:F-box protein [Legionellaceae bacterium]
MPKKICLLKVLPPENQLAVVEHLSTTDIGKLVLLSKHHYRFFKPVLAIHKLLAHVVSGAHERVQEMLHQDISLLYQKGAVTDYSNRQFGSVSAFEYTLWALDRHMWTTMMACLRGSNQDSEHIFGILRAQYHSVKTKGVRYALNGNTVVEKHFDFEDTMIKALQSQLDALQAPGPKDAAALEKQWISGVGGAQKCLPVHVVHEYCSLELPFHPVPEFNVPPAPTMQFFNGITEEEEDWFGVDSKLGIDFAIDKTLVCVAVGRGTTVTRLPGTRQVLAAMTALWERRTEDFIKLESQLDAQVEKAVSSVNQTQQPP